ncbi:glycerophosphodiester phosphodiesterase family protein [Kitasatospora sp. CM 4170]|uniref:Glycerophosphodiester phosphodiesterase family protein n=1 Tax=Kitasatospora aburaviensis TaxID=67265 RepID=A0ABW1EXF2_9ACTN|nr:glycerophosphodiester phosphodiesterase family protein [Kitasatospora sp. CM 4170]WNM46718.1 glycerophosphodiester phosphodiesterase family protein [Kitasatospora sp. CM 4170]
MTSPDLSPAAARTAPPVQVIAHRGSSHALPEHTLAAYRRALEEGADAVECDVRVTADGRLVCVHDRRIGRVSDGRGTVSAMTLAQLEAHDFGAWKTGVPSRDPELREVLRLESLLELVADCGRPVDLAIETKHPVRFRGRVESELLRMLDRFGIGGAHGAGAPGAAAQADGPGGDRPRARIMSFSSLALARVAAAAPQYPRVFLFERMLPLQGRLRPGAALPGGARIAGPGIDLVRAKPRLVTRLRELGHEVHVWTVDEPDDVELCLELGVSAIITNRPAEVLAQLGR